LAKSIVIVGGGSSGWMTASYLVKALPNVKITVVESAQIGTIGVGEATFSTIKLFFDFLGLEERQWMPRCSASYKLAIKYANWTARPGHFYHPFERFPATGGRHAGEWWLKLCRDKEAFDYTCFVTPMLCDAKRSPRFMDGQVYEEAVSDFFTEGKRAPNVEIGGHQVQYPFAYHFNAAEIATFLHEYATARGVTRIQDDVVEVPLREDGSIASVRTREHGAIEGDLFVDCTGFRGLLINKTLGEPFISFNDKLLNDSAVALQVPRDIEKEGIRPYTTAHAHSAGWSWNIPLYGRDGTGYVYCSKFIDKDEAEREFRAFLGPAADHSTPNHIRMRIGRCRRLWVKNCVAIGLAGGFVEPLESTGIFFVQLGIEELVNHFPTSSQPDENMTAGYNKILGECIDGVRDFLEIHYRASERVDTPYWRATKETELSDSLRARLSLWKARLPEARTIVEAFHGFKADSWAIMLLGLRYWPVSHLRVLDGQNEAEARRMFSGIKKRGELLVKELPSCYEYLSKVHRAS
jgi:tryptophan halogenase